MSLNKIFLISFSIYLGLSPIYWLPYIPPFVFVLIKTVLFSFICIFTLIFYTIRSTRFKIIIPGRYTFLYLLLGMMSIVFINLVLGNNVNNKNLLINFFQILFFVIASGIIINLNKVFYVVKLSIRVFSYFVVGSVICMLLMPDVINPFNNQLSLIHTGFGGLRTSWSPAVGLFIPYMLFIYGSILLLGIYLTSQVLTGGRAGFYVSILLLLPLIYTQQNWRLKVRFVLIILLLAIAILAYNPNLLFELRAFDSLSKSNSLDDLSTGRVELFLDAWGAIKNSPVLGYATKPSFTGDSVHNVFFKGWVNYGIVYMFFSILLVSYTLIQSVLKIKYSKNKYTKKFFIVSFLIIIYGIAIGMVEPSIIFGNFTNFSIWWFVFALVVSKDFNIINPTNTEIESKAIL